MERKVLYISSIREDLIIKLSDMLRRLGRVTQRAIWGKSFSGQEDAKSILYLDSAARGNLDMMRKSLGADIAEFVFFKNDSGKRFYVISEYLREESKDGAIFYKSSEGSDEIARKRVAFLDNMENGLTFFAVAESPFERSAVYSSRKSYIKRQISKGSFKEGGIDELYKAEEMPDVILCDAFKREAVLLILERLYGKPQVIHFMTNEADIYAPCSACERQMFIETGELNKEGILSVYMWLCDMGESVCAERLSGAVDFSHPEDFSPEEETFRVYGRKDAK